MRGHGRAAAVLAVGVLTGVAATGEALIFLARGYRQPRLAVSTGRWAMPCLTRLTRTTFTDSLTRASHNAIGIAGLRVRAILMSAGSNLGAPSKQLTAMKNGRPLRST